MRIPRIYTEQTLSAGSEVELEESSSHHLLKVLRMSEGRELILFNGSGGEYAATISMAGKKLRACGWATSVRMIASRH
jgi:RNA methyltransferase, RsmE family